MIDLEQKVKNTIIEKEYIQEVQSITFTDGESVSYDEFTTDYEEYIDPKDLEIKRLLGIIKDLENPSNREPRKKHRSLEEGEIKEIKELIELKNYVPDIAKEYDVSVSAIYRIGRDLKDMK